MRVLFICRSNAERSQIAEALFNGLSKKNRASSAGIAVENEGRSGWPPGRVATELMMDLGYDIQKGKRRQLTKKLFDEADMVIVILSSSEVRKFLPSYVAESPKTRVWTSMRAPMRIYTSFPPYTYSYHIRMLGDILHRVERLVEGIG
jgi:protein-tyrosine-phosphatase